MGALTTLLTPLTSVGGGSPSGPAGGHLSGTYPNPTLNPSASPTLNELTLTGNLSVGEVSDPTSSISLLSSNTGSSFLYFGDSDNQQMADIRYNHNTNVMSLCIPRDDGTDPEVRFTYSAGITSGFEQSNFSIRSTGTTTRTRMTLDSSSGPDYLLINDANLNRFELRHDTSSTPEFQIDSTTGSTGINGAAGGDAQFQVTSTMKGVRLSNMTTAEKNAISSPQKGLEGFDTTLNKPFFHDGTAFREVLSDNDIGSTVQADLDVVPQAEAEAGTATTERIWTAERVKQAIDALAGGGTAVEKASSTATTTVTGAGSDVYANNKKVSLSFTAEAGDYKIEWSIVMGGSAISDSFGTRLSRSGSTIQESLLEPKAQYNASEPHWPTHGGTIYETLSAGAVTYDIEYRNNQTVNVVAVKQAYLVATKIS